MVITFGGASTSGAVTQSALDAVAATIPPGWTQSAAKTANYTAAAYEIASLDTSGGTFTLTGPSGGKPFGYRWKAGAAAPTIAAPLGYTIAGAATATASLPPAGSSGELTLWQAFGTDYQPLSGYKPQAALNALNDARYDATGTAAAKVASVAATDATITVGGSATAPTVGVGAIPESKVTNLTTDLGGKLAAPANPSATSLVTISSTGTVGTRTLPDVQVFTSSGTWTKPAGATTVQIEMIGGGGGGGSGPRMASGTATAGGGSGAGGGLTQVVFRAADLAATESVTVGAGGTGGASVVTDSTVGSAGNGGVASTFGTTLKARASGGGGGGAGTTSAASTSTAGNGSASGSGGGGSAVGAAGIVGATAGRAGAGGGGGGGISVTPAAFSGGTGGAQIQLNAAGGAGGTSGGSGVSGAASPSTNLPIAAAGAGGGASSTTAAAGAGGTGAVYGAGGGGGGASLNTFASGAGGAGGAGIVVVTSW